MVDKKQRMIHDFFHISTNINVIAGLEEDAVPNNDCEWVQDIAVGDGQPIGGFYILYL